MLCEGNLAQSCAWNNGGCDQLCFECDDSHSCGCTDGQVLDTDGHSCVPGDTNNTIYKLSSLFRFAEKSS